MYFLTEKLIENGNYESITIHWYDVSGIFKSEAGDLTCIVELGWSDRIQVKGKFSNLLLIYATLGDYEINWN